MPSPPTTPTPPTPTTSLIDRFSAAWALFGSEEMVSHYADWIQGGDDALCGHYRPELTRIANEIRAVRATTQIDPPQPMAGDAQLVTSLIEAHTRHRPSDYEAREPLRQATLSLLAVLRDRADGMLARAIKVVEDEMTTTKHVRNVWDKKEIGYERLDGALQALGIALRKLRVLDGTIPTLTPPEPRIVWRGSASDFVTDLVARCSSEAALEVAIEIIGRRHRSPAYEDRPSDAIALEADTGVDEIPTGSPDHPTHVWACRCNGCEASWAHHRALLTREFRSGTRTPPPGWQPSSATAFSVSFIAEPALGTPPIRIAVIRRPVGGTRTVVDVPSSESVPVRHVRIMDAIRRYVRLRPVEERPPHAYGARICVEPIASEAAAAPAADAPAPPAAPTAREYVVSYIRDPARASTPIGIATVFVREDGERRVVDTPFFDRLPSYERELVEMVRRKIRHERPEEKGAYSMGSHFCVQRVESHAEYLARLKVAKDAAT